MFLHAGNDILCRDFHHMRNRRPGWTQSTYNGIMPGAWHDWEPAPIKEVLLDIAERGRSLGVILVGAQQTASEVERRIVTNSAIRVVGRLDPAEASRPEYGFLPPAQRQRALLAKPGTMFVSQPEIPVPLVVEFPFPAWATRQSEAASVPAAANGVRRDPFARLPATPVDDAPF